jgi:integrase
MAGIRKKIWNTKRGKNYCYEITFYMDGKLHRKSGYATKQAAQDDLEKVTKEVSTNIRLKELCYTYINEHSQLHCKETTKKLYEGYVNNNLFEISQKRAKDIKKRDIDLLILKYKTNGLSNKSINNIIGFLKSVYKYGIINKWLSVNPVNDIKKLPKVTREIKYLTSEQMKQFEAVIQTFPIDRYVPLLLDLYSGMRISELLALEWSDIDAEHNTITINKQYYKGSLTTTKTYKSTRKISVPNFIIKKLYELKASQKVSSKIIFCGDTGHYINQGKFVLHWFKKAIEAIGLQDYNFHCLRHTYATYLLSNSVPIKFVQEQLGHSTAQTTLNVYGHVMPNVNLDAMNLLNKIQYEQNMSKVKNVTAKT